MKGLLLNIWYHKSNFTVIFITTTQITLLYIIPYINDMNLEFSVVIFYLTLNT